eukprot:TRINITY_DN8094_c0_g1_i2.p2 TRINITY_DN8094_c0_g1~~TRINITY_DN8094_c0_g1_i2.p2  ORF type:complete len:300 (+),score=103.14 TRINITY_DN8094_c0_g1_i2:1236-2135(+)
MAFDDVIELLSGSHAKRGERVSSTELPETRIREVLSAAREVLLHQPGLLELEAPVQIAGDIHGQHADLLYAFEMCGAPGTVNWLFLGDYVDRGPCSIEVMCLLLAYKVTYPGNVFLLRGNHECGAISRIYGFYDECKRRYNIKLWKAFLDVFNALPFAAVVGESIFCVHGGPSPALFSLRQIERLHRPVDVPDYGLVADLLWADPSDGDDGWCDGGGRSVTLEWGRDVAAKFLSDFHLDLICRAHQVVEDGYQFMFDRAVVTIFTARNYCGEFDNDGAVMCVAEDLTCSFRILKAKSKG